MRINKMQESYKIYSFLNLSNVIKDQFLGFKPYCDLIPQAVKEEYHQIAAHVILLSCSPLLPSYRLPYTFKIQGKIFYSNIIQPPPPFTLIKNQFSQKYVNYVFRFNFAKFSGNEYKKSQLMSTTIISAQIFYFALSRL